MRESLAQDELDKRRDKNIDKFCRNLMDALLYPKSSQDVINWIDDIFIKLKRLIANQSKIDHPEFQRKIFVDTCKFLNALNSNFEVRKFHNSISRTPIEEYNKMSLWEQFFNNAYQDRWNFEYDCKGWSCSYWTLSLYKFFHALRESGLDIKLSIYRLKNTNDEFVWVVSMRHSWLVINFQGFDYMIDYEWINDEFSWCLIQAVNSLKKEIEKYGIKDTDKLDDLKMINREKNSSRSKNNSMLVHFKNTEDFIEDVKRYPELKKISFITRKLRGGEPTRLDYEFFKKWVYIEVDDYQRIFILKDDAVLKKDKKEFLKSLAENIESVKDEFWDKKYSQLDKEELNLLLGLIENDINLDSVISEYK